jgi:Zn-dependent peptidase ImmA (M78 family)
MIPLARIWSTLRAVAAREGISVVFVRRLPAEGATLSALGTSCIMLRSSLRGRRRVEVLAHELAHTWLGHGADVVTPRGALRRRRAAEERQAERFAAVLLESQVVRFRYYHAILDRFSRDS